MSRIAKSYRASFYNEFVNAQGRVFYPCQRTFDMRSAQSRPRVVEAAKELFAQKEAVAHWKLRARRMELVEILLD